MKVKIIKDTFWFRKGETYDIDQSVAKQLVSLGEAEEVKEQEPAKVEKVEQSAKKRQTK